MKNPEYRFKNRDLSWLGFNYRVLQEARDPAVPLMERMKFLAIFSSNLDEFFRVRVASIRALSTLKKKTAKELYFDPSRLLRRIHKVVTQHQEEFGDAFRQIRKELAIHGTFLAGENDINSMQRAYVHSYFEKTIRPLLNPVFLHPAKEPPFLQNRQLYLVIQLRRELSEHGEYPDTTQHAIVAIPADSLSRFLELPEENGHRYVMFLDDAIRACIAEVFPFHRITGIYAIKLSRDAELYIDDEYSGNLVEKIKKALSKRNAGIPSRFLYDSDMPKQLLMFLQRMWNLGDDDLVNGGRYHNFNDLFTFPGATLPSYDHMKPLPKLDGNQESMFDEIATRDQLLYFPYHSYEPVIRFLREAADDPNVRSIDITLYRVARHSRIVEQLLRAAQQGKRITAFVEIKARFDEESNIRWAEELEKAGARILYSIPGRKVHAKLCLVTRQEGSALAKYVYLSTGNFNENAACLYTDFGFFTADTRLTDEVATVFDILGREKETAAFKHLLVAPFAMRKKFEKLIDNEIKNAGKKRPARIIAKMNSLEDRKMIAKLYEASHNGVTVSLIVRGICCLLPGLNGLSHNIQAVSIVDRFLEHARVYIFYANGKERYYLSSADWMKRNLRRRIEIAFPIYDSALQQQIRTIVDLQLQDNVKARIVDKGQTNALRGNGGKKVRAQFAIYDVLRNSPSRNRPSE